MVTDSVFGSCDPDVAFEVGDECYALDAACPSLGREVSTCDLDAAPGEDGEFECRLPTPYTPPWLADPRFGNRAGDATAPVVPVRP
ncbi:MAG TPA: hypothetical protein RMF84_21140 [Polyangiaceae bacterium LLY-WYZ-14_1]|nr:hypothetical protein [Polyangiaceae bacterium LLY-WYZ-14_1]